MKGERKTESSKKLRLWFYIMANLMRGKFCKRRLPNLVRRKGMYSEGQ
jgi:hypothetical protein